MDVLARGRGAGDTVIYEESVEKVEELKVCPGRKRNEGWSKENMVPEGGRRRRKEVWRRGTGGPEGVRVELRASERLEVLLGSRADGHRQE